MKKVNKSISDDVANLFKENENNDLIQNSNENKINSKINDSESLNKINNDSNSYLIGESNSINIKSKMVDISHISNNKIDEENNNDIIKIGNIINENEINEINDISEINENSINLDNIEKDNNTNTNILSKSLENVSSIQKISNEMENISILYLSQNDKKNIIGEIKENIREIIKKGFFPFFIKKNGYNPILFCVKPNMLLKDVVNEYNKLLNIDNISIEDKFYYNNNEVDLNKTVQESNINILGLMQNYT